MAVGAELVRVVGGFRVPNQHAGRNQSIKVRRTPLVDCIRIGIGAFRQIDLGLGDMQKAVRSASGPLPGFRAG